MRAITGNPGFSYSNVEDVDDVFAILEAADALDYLMAASTLAGGD